MQFGFIFDMDGTMIDNMMVHHRAWQLKLQALGLNYTLEQVRQEIHGKNEEILKRLFGEQLNDSERARHAWEKEALYRKVFADELCLIDGVANFLAACQAQNIPLSIGTAAPPENVNFVLDNLNLHAFFKGVVDASMVTKGKPDPEVFEKAANLLQLTANQVVVFEDSPTGVATAQRFGCPAVVLTTTHEAHEFEEFENVLKFIKDFNDISPQLVISWAKNWKKK
jgi:HAD superfamily hydrolase (TIGR01509 family)